MNHYQRLLLNSTRTKYFKYKSRLDKNLANGTFQAMPYRKRKSLVEKVDKFRKRLETWNISLRRAMVAGTVTGAALVPNLADAQIDPNIYLNEGSTISLTSPRSIVAINIDADEDLELIATTSLGGEVGQWDGKDSYEFNRPNSLEYATQLLIVGDIDGDSDDDIIFTNNGDGTYLYKGINTGLGTINETYIGNSNRPDDIELVDWDSDGDLDILIATGDSYLTVFENDGAGNFSSFGSFDLGGEGTIGSDGNIDSFAFADMDDDGDLDLVHNAYLPIGPYYTGSIVVLENTTDGPGTPTFNKLTPAFYSQVNYSRFDHIELMDHDGDGDLDIFFHNSSPDGYLFSNQYIEGSSFTFNSVGVSYIGSGIVNDVVVGDFDNDGNDELILASNAFNRLLKFDGSILQGVGGNLGGEIGNLAGDLADIFVADLNGDDNLDLVGADNRAGSVATYLDRSAPFISYFSGDLIVEENTPPGHVIANFGFTDTQGDPIFVSLAGDDASYFAFDEISGDLSINADLDWETNGSDLDLRFDLSDGMKSQLQGGTVKIKNLAEEGNGTFDPEPIKLFGDRQVTLFEPGDYDMDGDTDLFLASPDGQFYNSLLQQNSGSFTDVGFGPFGGEQNAAAFVHNYAGQDLIVHDPSSNEIRRVRNDNGFSSDYTTLQTGISDVDKMITGDFDGDGRFEFAVVASTDLGNEVVHTFEDDPSDGWINNQYFLMSDGSTGLLDGVGNFDEIEIADFNGDGYGDMLATTVNGDDVIFLGGETGISSTFSPLITQADGGETEIAIGDIDGDGSTDIAIMRWEDNVNYQIFVDIHVNNGYGSFSLDQSIGLGGEFWGNIDLDDIDGDGDKDLITTNLKAVDVGGEIDFSLSIETFTNDGAGYFSLFQTIEEVGGEGFKMMDVDGDDDLDIVLIGDIGAPVGEELQLKVFKNTNVSPTAINLSTTTIDEHLPIDTEIATVTVDDLNIGDNHLLSIATGDGSNDAHNNFFAVEGSSLVITRDVSAEDYPTLNILLAANDGENIYEQALTLTVNQVNVAPSAITAPTSFDEGTAAGTSIGTLSATDDGLETVTFALATGDGSNDADNGSFIIDGDQLIITEESSFETKPSYNIYISASDIDGSVEQAFTINVNDLNQAPTAITLSTTSIEETVTAGSAIATIDADDPNAGDTHTFALVAGDGSNDVDNSKFLIEGDQLIIKQNASFETQSSYNIHLSATDSEGSVEQAFTISVNNTNELPTAITLSATSVDEEVSGGTAVATIDATDPNAGDEHDFELVAGDGSNDADNDKFLIDGDQLVIKSSPDFDAQSSYSIYLSASDSEGSVEQAFTLTVNEFVSSNNGPTGISLSSDTFDEGIAGGSAVATLTADDADAGDTHSFSFATGDGSNDADNNDFLIDGDQLVIKASPSFEAQSSYNIYLSTSDGEDSFEQAFTLTVNNLNTAPTGIQISATAFDEGIAGGSSVATLTADDADAGDSHAFTLATGDGTNDADNDKFLIDGDQLVIKSSPSFETQASYNIYLSAADTEGSVEQAFTLTVNNLNSVPTGIQLSSDSFDEGIAGGSAVATLTADDADAGDSHEFTLATGDGTNDADNNRFLIDGDQLVIKTSPSFETQASYNIYLSAADSEGSVEQAFTLTVNNVNELPTAITLSAATLNEDTPAGSVVATIDATDVNASDEHVFALVAGDGTNDVDNDKFVIEDDQLIIKQNSRFETQPSYRIYLSAADSEGSIEQAFVIDVVDINQGPNSISLSVTSLDESIAVGSTAATISATDPNAGDTQTFSLVEGDGTNDAHNELFLINGNALILIEEIEFDDLQSININIQASDGQETLTQSFTLIINEVLGVQDEITNTLGVYPNPGGSQFQINYESGLREDLILRVSDLSGRMVHEIAAAKTGDSFTYRVDMSGAKAGIYLIELITSEKIITQRWVKN